MKKTFVILLALVLFSLTGCAQMLDGDGMVRTYTHISQDEAMEMMAKEDGHVVVDVRRQDEYDAGHIPGAILIPNESIGTEQPKELPDLDQIILIYCRSGNRSKQAAQKLFDMGYTRIFEFGGINTWKGDVVTGETAAAEDYDIVAEAHSVPTLVIEVNGRTLFASFEDNSSAEALKEKLSSGEIEMELHDYGRFEKVGSLPWDLPRNDVSVAAAPGDVILYQGNQITIYYGENTWNMTRLAKIDNVAKEELLGVFGEGDVTVQLRVERSE